MFLREFVIGKIIIKVKIKKLTYNSVLKLYPNYYLKNPLNICLNVKMNKWLKELKLELSLT